MVPGDVVEALTRRRSGRDAGVCDDEGMIRRDDAREAAGSLRRLLDVVDDGEVGSTAMERHAIEGAALTLDALAEPRPGRRPEQPDAST